MTTSSDLVDQIGDNATKPAQASQDGRSASQHSLKDQIEAARFLAEQEAANAGRLGIGFFLTKPPGAV